MKVVGIACSPREGGNTEILVREALSVVQESGAETELITIHDKTIYPCDGCEACVREGICRIKDDMQYIYQQLLSADAIIFGTPVYFQNVTAQAKAVMDRTFAFMWHYKLRGKVAAAIVVTRRIGGGQVRNLLYSYFLAQRMLVAGGAIGYGRKKGDVRDGPGGQPDTLALDETRGVAKAVVRLCQRLSG